MAQSESLSENKYTVTFCVDPKQNGSRLDSFLKFHYKRRSREQIKKAVVEGQVKLIPDASREIGKLRPASQVLTGDQIQVISPKKSEPTVNLDFSIIFEDEALLVVNKPGNLPVHPAGGFFFNTLLTELQIQRKTQLYLAHRIDKETSGLVLLTKKADLCSVLTEQFSNREVKKTYLAIVHGSVEFPFFSCDSPMRRAIDSKVKLKMEVHKEGLIALTSFELIQHLPPQNGIPFSLVKCFPKTGRQHQIRLHLASLGHPIVGDKLYSLTEEEALYFYEKIRNIPKAITDKLVLPRHALHAAEICFLHPLSGEMMGFTAPMPDDLTPLIL